MFFHHILFNTSACLSTYHSHSSSHLLFFLFHSGEKFAKDLGCSYLEISAADSYQQIVDLLHELYREAKMYKFGTKSSLLGRVFGHSREKKTMTL